MKSFLESFLYNSKGKVSKTKLGTWLSLAVATLKFYGIVDDALWQTLQSVAGTVWGIGIRDVFNSKS